MSRRLLVALAALVGFGFTVIRDPSTLAPIRWPSTSVTMVIQQDGAAGITDGTDILAIRAALSTWGLPACTSFRFVDGGLSPTGVSADDGTNRIFFTQSWSHAAGVVALTEQRSSGSGPETWHDADISVNEQDFAWATDGDLQSYDVQSVVTHELGHVLGLAHSPILEATMYFGYSKGLTFNRTLHDDDRRGVCFIYAAGSFACATDEDCPLYFGDYYGGADVREKCTAPSCVSGKVGYGGACQVNGDCTSNICFKGLDSAPATDPGFCTQACTVSPSNCPNGDYCHADTTGGGRGNVCHMGYVDCVADNDCVGPTPPWYCVRDLDGHYRCLATCLQDIHCTAIPGAICHGAKSSSEPGFCRVPGTGADGVPCQDGYGCASLYCTGTSTQPVCGRNSTPIDTGPTPDGPAPVDPGRLPDGRPGADPAIASDLGADSRLHVDPNGTSSDAGAALVGGCACSSATDAGLVWGVLVAVASLVAARDRRRRTKTR